MGMFVRALSYMMSHGADGLKQVAEDAVLNANYLRARQGVPNLLAGEIRVVDEQMREVPPDGETLGEVVMRGNVVMKGYFAQPDATSEAFRGGWFHSGDVGVMHPDGNIELRDRKKDIIISGGSLRRSAPWRNRAC